MSEGSVGLPFESPFPFGGVWLVCPFPNSDHTSAGVEYIPGKSSCVGNPCRAVPFLPKIRFDPRLLKDARSEFPGIPIGRCVFCQSS